MTGKTITSSTNAGYYLYNLAFNPVTVVAGVTITDSGFAALSTGVSTYASGAPAFWTIINSGTLLATGQSNQSDGVWLYKTSGEVTNTAGGSITGYYIGISISNTGTVFNQGTIATTGTAGSGFSYPTGEPFTATSAGVILGAGGVSNTGTGLISGYFEGVAVGGGGSVVNAGTILATGTTHSYGIVLTAGGSVTNTQTGAIFGHVDGVLTFGEPATVINQGYIGGFDYGIGLVAGGMISNAADGVIVGGKFGMYAEKASATLTNDGFIIGYNVVGVALFNGGTITNEASGKIAGGEFGIYTSGAATSTVINIGTIVSYDFTAAWLNAGGSLNNTGIVSGVYYGAKVGNAPGTVVNAGTISASVEFRSADTSFDSVGVQLADGGTVTNNAGGLITSNWTGIQIFGGPGSVMNAGTISASVASLSANTTFTSAGVQLADGGVVTNATGGTIASYSMGVQIFNASGTVVNAGSISASATLQQADTIFGSAGVQLADGGVVTNSAGGRITSNWTGVQIYTAGGTIINQGTILAAHDGIFTSGSAASTVFNAGTVSGGGYTGAWLYSGGSLTNSGTIFGKYFGVEVSNVSGTVVNSGSITDSVLGTGAGVQLAAGGVVTNSVGGHITSEWMGIQIGASPTASVGGTVVNYGTILAADFEGDGAGIWIHGPGAITNAAGGLISGGAFGIVAYYQTTVVNQGTVFGTEDAFDAVRSGFADRIIDDPGAVFSGAVVGGNSLGSAIYSTLELASGSSTGTIVNVATFTGFGLIALDAGATWSVGGSIVAGETVAFGGTHASLILASPSAAAATMAGFAATDTIVLSGITDVDGLSFNGNTLIVSESGDSGLTLQFTAPESLTYAEVAGSTDIFVPCFLPGTHILTDLGEVLVEKLRVGDTIVTLGGHTRRLCWIGQGRALATRGRRSAATPVIVRKGALADNVPHLDLHITKGHSLYLDGVLIPVEFLINHRSIVWDDRAQEVTVFHLELDAHDVLIANGVPSESYRDDGNRWLFQNANAGWDQPPKAPCAPILTGGPLVDAVWQRILERAGPRPGQPLTDDPDLHLLVDGHRIEAAEKQDSVHVFRLTKRPETVHIASREAVPAELGLARDPRSLGVALRRIAVRQGTKFVVLRADDAGLRDGFHPYESTKDLRWTDGCATLPADAFAGFKGGIEIVLHLAETTRYPNDGAGSVRVAA
jgi:hypothetical protein